MNKLVATSFISLAVSLCGLQNVAQAYEIFGDMMYHAKE